MRHSRLSFTSVSPTSKTTARSIQAFRQFTELEPAMDRGPRSLFAQRGVQPIDHPLLVEFPLGVPGPILHAVRRAIQYDELIAGARLLQPLGIGDGSGMQFILRSL